MDGHQEIEPAGFVRSRGLKFPRRQPFITPRIRRALRTDSYETNETEAALKVVRKDDVVVELGAGIGYMSTLVARKRAVSHVHAFEANPRLIPYIEAVHAANDVTNVTLHNAVLGAGEGTATFYVRKNFIASSLTPIEGKMVEAEEEVDVRDARTTMASIRPDVLICDIEGAEVDVIPLMDLSSLRAAIVELHPQWIGPEGVNTVFSAFIAAGLAYSARGSRAKVVTFRRDWPTK